MYSIIDQPLPAFLVGALLGTVLFLLLVKPLVLFIRRIGWLDIPNGRKVHDGAIPLAGGPIIATTTSLLFAALNQWSSPVGQIWACSLAVFVIAFVDDRFPLRARYRFLVQCLAAFGVAYGLGIRFEHLGELLGPWTLPLGIAAIPMSVLCMVAYANALNMLDGVDGLCGGVTMVTLASLVIVLALIAPETAALQREGFEAGASIAVICGALLGFLFMNQRSPWRSRAAMFLGDSGSMTLGMLTGALVVYCCSRFGQASLPATSALWLLGIPVIDISTAIVRRVRMGVTPMTPDRKHVHHLLMAMGLPISRVVVLLQIATAGMAAIGILGWQLGVPDYLMLAGFIAVALVYLRSATRFWDLVQPEPAVRNPQRIEPGAVPERRVDRRAVIRERRGARSGITD